MNADLGVDIAGVGMHPFGRFPDRSLKDLARVAALRAMGDASVTGGDIDAVYSSNSVAGLLGGQEQIRGQTVMSEIGIGGIPIVNVENACASGSTALREAIMAVRVGEAGVALVVGFEKMFLDDRARTLDAIRSAADLDAIAGLGLQFPAVYAMRLRRRLDDGSLTMGHLAGAAVKSRRFGAVNRYAQKQKAVTVDEVLTSRPVAEPLTVLMCSSITDGAAAVVVAREGRLATEHDRVVLRASAMRTARPRHDGEPTLVTACATAAYEASGVAPADVDVLEVHDAMAPGELLMYEQVGLCADGEGGRLLEDGVTDLGGRHVVNPSGGLTSRGHPIGATGLAQIVELTWQLRGEATGRQVPDARLALAQNSGGWLDGESAVCNVHILERR